MGGAGSMWDAVGGVVGTAGTGGRLSAKDDETGDGVDCETGDTIATFHVNGSD